MIHSTAPIIVTRKINVYTMYSDMDLGTIVLTVTGLKIITNNLPIQKKRYSMDVLNSFLIVCRASA